MLGSFKLLKLAVTFQFWLQSDKSNGHFTSDVVEKSEPYFVSDPPVVRCWSKAGICELKV